MSEDFGKRSRRGTHSSGEIDKQIGAFDTILDEIMEDLARTLRTENPADCEFSIESRIKRLGPYVYGYISLADAEGHTSLREFDNIGFSRDLFHESQEQLVDIIDEPKQVRIIAELPGADISTIKCAVGKDTITISASSVSRRYWRRLQLSTDVLSDSLRVRYNNGSLEVTLQKAEDLTRPNSDRAIRREF